MKSLKHGAGYLIIDHRDSPGVRPEDVAHVPGAVAAPGGTQVEMDVYQCSHCQRTIVLRAASKERMQARGYCPKCHHYVCNGCEAIRVKTGACVPFKQILDRAGDLAEKFVGQPDHPDAVVDAQALAEPGPPRIVVPGGGTP